MISEPLLDNSCSHFFGRLDQVGANKILCRTLHVVSTFDK